jgi:transposase
MERARIVLRCAEGSQDKDIAAEFGITPEKAARWRRRFLQGGIGALCKDAPRPGRPRIVSVSKVRKIIDKTTGEKPDAATARARSGALRGRKKSDPSAGSNTAWIAAEERPLWNDDT